MAKTRGHIYIFAVKYYVTINSIHFQQIYLQLLFFFLDKNAIIACFIIFNAQFVYIICKIIYVALSYSYDDKILI
jgi:hypothetical protein